MLIKQWCLTTLGILCLALGAIGIVLPVLPTTPFVIAAALCFSAGSPHLAAWLEKKTGTSAPTSNITATKPVFPSGRKSAASSFCG